MQKDGPRILYSAFDVVPSPKGASTHIRYFTRGLVAAGYRVDLVTAHGGALLEHDTWEGASVWRVPRVAEQSFLQRAATFGQSVMERAEAAGEGHYAIAHFRSLWCGLPLTGAKKRLGYRTVFEVNGLPSVELKYHYPAVRGSGLVDKLRAQEAATLLTADWIICPSRVTAAFIESLGVPGTRITVIHNGADQALFAGQRAVRAPGPDATLLYLGTLADWQGLDTVIRALPLVSEHHSVRLRIVGTGRGRQRRRLLRLAQRLGVAERLSIEEPVPHDDVGRLMADVDVTIVPLAYNDRNVTQGCCPLKLIEAMAGSCPIVASDLPVVRELVREGRDALLFEPGDHAELARKIGILLENPTLARSLAQEASARAAQSFDWSRSQQQLLAVYEELLAS